MIFPCFRKRKTKVSELDQEISFYENTLKNNGFPVLFTTHHLCLAAGMNVKRVLNMCNSDRKQSYKRFKLKKRRGGYRIIHTPISEIKYLQRWILIHILDKADSSDVCCGLEKGKSIILNAEAHLGANAILKMDLKRFYDTINERRIYGIFRAFGYHPNLAVDLAKICTVVPDSSFINSFKEDEFYLKEAILQHVEGMLPQGAPTSPKLSNLTAKHLDKRLLGLATAYGASFSRYADDLTFSGEYKDLKHIKKIAKYIIRDESFFVNHHKTRIIKKGGKMRVTGINVENGKPQVPKKTKDMIEFHLHHCNTNGVANHMQIAGIQKRNFKEWLYGYICFVNSVEPDVGKDYFLKYEKIEWPL